MWQDRSHIVRPVLAADGDLNAAKLVLKTQEDPSVSCRNEVGSGVAKTVRLCTVASTAVAPG